MIDFFDLVHKMSPIKFGNVNRKILSLKSIFCAIEKEFKYLLS